MLLTDLTKESKIVFFDGYCGLCNRFVNLLLGWDKKNKLMFAALQGNYAVAHLKGKVPEGVDSIVVESNGVVLIKSAAVFEVVRILGWPWKALLIFSILPRKLNDGIYDMVARNRYGLFGKRDTCRLPGPEERSRFLT